MHASPQSDTPIEPCSIAARLAAEAAGITLNEVLHAQRGCRDSTAARALVILGLPREGPVTVGMNVPSRRHGRKDIIRVEGLELRR